MVIIDEPYKLKTIILLREICELITKEKYCLMLTATPIQNDLKNYTT